MIKRFILIGASTGGPGLIETILKGLDKEFEATLIIAQHMDKVALKSFASRLSRITGIDMVYIDYKTTLKSSKIYILSDTFELKKELSAYCLDDSDIKESFYHPTIDTLFKSASIASDVDVSAFLLSGIGSDGAKGLLELKQKGFYTVAQGERSSIVYGMPKSAFELGATCEVLEIDDIVKKIVKISRC